MESEGKTAVLNAKSRDSQVASKGTSLSYGLSGLVMASLILLSLQSGSSQVKRVYIANDDHTDLVWTADQPSYQAAFVQMLDYYLDQADSTSGDPSDFQGRFSADGHYWLWNYEHSRTPQQFQRLIDRIADGHITVPLQALVICYGGMPAEAILRSMYYPGRIERKYGVKFELVSAMENQTLPYGLPSLWAGAGARYSWKGVCGCATTVTNLGNRGREIYNAVGPDGRSVLTKWHSVISATASGGYAEAYDPSAAVDYVTGDSQFLLRYPYDTVVGMFGKGYDGFTTFTTQFLQVARAKSSPTQRVIVSNEVDFFKDFETSAPPALVPSFSGGFGNEWDVYSASMAEVTATIKRSVEALRTAEGLATLVSLKDASFIVSRMASADSAFTNMGLFYEHDWTADGPVSSQRPAYQRSLATQIVGYVDRLTSDAAASLGTMIQGSPGASRYFVFNPLGWTRTEYADLPVSPAGPSRVIDISTGQEVPGQPISLNGKDIFRILAVNVPSFGYRVYEVQPGQSQFTTPAATFSNGDATFENGRYRVTVNGRGAITSLIDKQDGGREWVQSINSRTMNDIGSGSGTPVRENVGPVSATIFVDAGGSPSHRARVTLYAAGDRIDLDNEVTSNFGNSVTTYSFGLNISGYTVHHEEIGAIAVAAPISAGGNYSDRNGRYDYLSLNHFVDLSDAQRGVTLSSLESSFFRLGNSAGSAIDMSTPRIAALVGGRVDANLGISNQDGDSYFRNRYALSVHGSFDQASSMRTALEHQNPLFAGAVTGSSGSYPPDVFSLFSLSDSSVVAWAVKPAEEGIADANYGGVILRLWNVTSGSRNIQVIFNGTIQNAGKTTHIETDTGPASFTATTLVDTLPAQWMQTYRLRILPTVSVRDGELQGMPKTLRLYPNFPNPFNPETTIRFSVPQSTRVRLVLYDVLGNKVATLVDSSMSAGMHNYHFQAAEHHLGSGVYLLRLEAGSATQVQKLLYLK